MRKIKRTVAAILAFTLIAGPAAISSAKADQPTAHQNPAAAAKADRKPAATTTDATPAPTTSPAATPTTTPTAPAGVPDITDEQVTALVKESLDKFEKEDCVSLIYYSNSDSYSFEAYDRANNIAAYSGGISSDVCHYVDFTAESDLTNWVDINKSLIYSPNNNKKNETVYTYYPLKPIDLDDIMKQCLVLTLKTGLGSSTLPLAEAYTYVGNTWVYGLSGEKHLCYIAEVSDDDSTIYDIEKEYGPKRLYIGVNDKTLYRIDEELSEVKSEASDTSIYYTYFSYPGSLAIPERITKNSVLSDEYQIEKKQICYRMLESNFHPGEFLMHVTSTADGFSKKTLKIPSTIKAAGNTFKVEAIEYEAFSYSQIKKAILGKYIKEIGDKAFAHCKKLKKLIIKNKKMKKYAKTAKGRKRLGIGKSVIIR